MADKVLFSDVDVLDVLERNGERIVDLILIYAKQYHADKSGQIGLRSRFTATQPRDGLFVLNVFIDDYYKYLNDGTKGGAYPPINKLKDWMARNNIDGRKAYLSKLKNPQKSKITFDKAQTSLAWAIRKSIFKKGTIKRFGYKGSGFFDKFLRYYKTEPQRKFEEEMSELLGQEIALNLFG